MKLIDLLVQELPKRGGWPEGVNEIGQDYDGELMFYGRGNVRTGIYLPLSYDHRDIYCRNGDKVTKDRYESALAASQNSSWNGEGLPQVGCECECHVDECVIHCIVVGYDFDGKAVVMRNVPARKYFSIHANSGRIKLLRTEAERKRDAALDAIYGAIASAKREHNRSDEADEVYKAIAAGKIPGVKLDD